GLLHPGPRHRRSRDHSLEGRHPCRLDQPRRSHRYGVAQTLIYALTLSVALLADLIHNFGDASTAIPLGLAFVLRSARRTARRARSRARDLRQCLCRARPDDPAFHPPHTLAHLWWLAA